LFEAFRREQQGHGSKAIVLSTEVTGMSRATRKRAIAELVKLRLIRVSRYGKQAVKVVEVYYY
jgi:hypothetical protein